MAFVLGEDHSQLGEERPWRAEGIAHERLDSEMKEHGSTK